MVIGFVLGFLIGSTITYFLLKGSKKKYHSTMDDIHDGLHKLKGMLNDIERKI
jgi:hypothetical protein